MAIKAKVTKKLVVEPDPEPRSHLGRKVREPVKVGKLKLEAAVQEKAGGSRPPPSQGWKGGSPVRRPSFPYFLPLPRGALTSPS